MKRPPFKIKADYIFENAKKGTALNVRVFYECDPELNCECNKKCCFVNGGECRHTAQIRYAKRYDISE